MTYFQGFLIPVRGEQRQAYLDLATEAAAILPDYGALGSVECWEQEVPDGKLTDMRRAVAAEPGEKIVLSWVLWPDRATCDAAIPKIMADERMQLDDPAFNPQRMIYGGFEVAYDRDRRGGLGYVDGMIAPAPGDGYETFANNAETLDRFFLDHGALRRVDGWGVDVPKGKCTDLRRAVAAEDNEQVIFGWIEWPDKAVRDAAFATMSQAADGQAIPHGFDMKRAIFGGFTPILDTTHR